MTRRIGVFVFDGAEELDFVGPREVLATGAKSFPDDDAEICTFAVRPDTVTCAKGLRVIADHTLDTAPPMDVLVYPGGEGNRAHIGDDAIKAWLLKLQDGGTLMTSVCTGS